MTIVVNERICELLPPSVRRQARLKLGDRLDVKVSEGVITMMRHSPKADDEYTSEQREAILAEVAEARRGPFHGPFRSGEELAVYLKEFKRGTSSRRKRSG